jgi:hypothetical protein
MKNILLKGFIRFIALGCLATRWFAPELSVDKETLMILALAVAPWLSSVVKGVELFGFKVEFQENKPPDQLNSPDQPKRREGTERHGQDYERNRSGTVRTAGDDYGTVALKITPFEMIVVFLVTNAAISATTGSALLLWVNFFLVLAFTPIHLFFAEKIHNYRQLAASTIGFAVWVFALGGPFATLKLYQPMLGALFLAIYWLVAPMLIMQKLKH